MMKLIRFSLLATIPISVIGIIRNEVGYFSVALALLIVFSLIQKGGVQQ